MAIADAIARFLKNGGEVQVLGTGGSESETNVSAHTVHSRHAKQEDAKRKMQASNRALFINRTAIPASPQTGGVDLPDDEDEL